MPGRKRIISIQEELDIVIARQAGRELAREIGFDLVDQTRITTAISELARNIVLYTTGGKIIIYKNDDGTRSGLEILAVDDGPGIVDLDMAMKEGFSTSNGLGAGLPGVRRLMDEFSVETKPGKGTRVKTKKFLKNKIL